MIITSEVTPREFHDLPHRSSVAELRVEANSLVPAESVRPTGTYASGGHPAA